MSQQTPEFFHNAEHTAYLIWFSANYISLQCVWSYVRLIKIENRRLVDHDLPYNIFTLRVNKAVCIPCPAKTLILFEVELFMCFKTSDYDPESWSCNQRFRNRHPSLYSGMELSTIIDAFFTIWWRIHTFCILLFYRSLKIELENNWLQLTNFICYNGLTFLAVFD